MSEKKSVRLNKLAKEFNVSIERILSFLEEKGEDGMNPSSKVSHNIYMDLLGEFDSEKKAKLSADISAKEREEKREQQRIEEEEAKLKSEEDKKIANELAAKKKEVKVIGKIDLEPKNKKVKEEVPKESPKEEVLEEMKEETKDGVIRAAAQKLTGPKITGQKIDLSKLQSKNKKPAASSSGDTASQKKKRKRITTKVNPKKFTKGKARVSKD